MAEKDALEVLGLDTQAGFDDIKQAYRYLARKYHPDYSGRPETGRRFSQVVQAYKDLRVRDVKTELLSTPIRKTERSGDVLEDLAGWGRRAVEAPTAEERKQAVRRLGFCGRKSAYVYLRRALYDRDEGVVAAAVRSVADLGLHQAASELPVLWARGSLRLRRSLLDSAEQTGESLFEPLLRLASREPSPEGRRARSLLGARPMPRGRLET